MKTINKYLWLLTALVPHLLLAQPQFWGLTSSGGKYNGGTIYRTDANGNNLEVVHHFQNSVVDREMSELTETPDGRLFGVNKITNGTSGYKNFIFEYLPGSNQFVVRAYFEQTATGISPVGKLLYAGNKLYGLCNLGGYNNLGTLFSYDLSTDTLVKLADFDGLGLGKNPTGSLTKASDGKLYGASAGGTYNKGLIFSYDTTTGDFVNRYTFNSTIKPPVKMVQASNGNFYYPQNTGSSGQFTLSSVVEFNPVNNTLLIKAALPNDAFNMTPLSLTSDGNLYGYIKYFENNAQVSRIYKYNYTNNTISYLYTLTDDMEEGTNLSVGSDNKLYGYSRSKTTSNTEYLFSFNPSNNSYSNIFTFTKTTGRDPKQLFVTSSGIVYGSLIYGGTYDKGIFYSFQINNSEFIKKHEFEKYKKGSKPLGALLRHSDGYLYGMASMGGEYNKGTLFRVHPLNLEVEHLHSFNDTLGRYPESVLFEQDNGKMLGFTPDNKAGKSSLFEFDPVAKTFLVLLEGPEEGIFFRDSSNNVNYMSKSGWVYKYIRNGNNTQQVLAPHSSFITQAYGNPILASNGKYYALSYASNINASNSGQILECDLHNKKEYKSLAVLSDSNLNQPIGSLTEGGDGRLYGVSQQTVFNNTGAIFSYNTNNNQILANYRFSQAELGHPKGALLLSPNDKLYGIASASLFEFDPDSNTVKSKFQFTNLSGGGWNNYTTLTEYCQTDKPAAAKSIVGDTLVCSYSPVITLQTDTIAGATFYRWWLPQGAVVIEGDSTNTITISLESVAQGKHFIRVAGGNICGIGKRSSIKVNNLYASVIHSTGFSHRKFISPHDSTFVWVQGELKGNTHWEWHWDNPTGSFAGIGDTIWVKPSDIDRLIIVKPTGLCIENGVNDTLILPAKDYFFEKIVGYEYFFDTEPGINSGTYKEIVPSNDTLIIPDSISTQGLSEGFHKLYYRFKNNFGEWSFTEGRPFYVTTSADLTENTKISAIEYFIDDEPGTGSGNITNIQNENDTLEHHLTIQINTLSEGFHKLYSRVRDANGLWSTTEGRAFYIIDNSNIYTSASLEQAEYFIDTDPGIGNAGYISLSTTDTVAQTILIQIDSLNTGFHNLYLRVKDTLGNWSIQEKRPFFVVSVNELSSSAPISKIEYFFGKDEASGVLTQIPVNPSEDTLNTLLQIDLTGRELGGDSLYVRVFDESGTPSLHSFAPFNLVSCPDTVYHQEYNICSGESIPFGDTILNSSGTYWFYLTNNIGCDSITELTLNVQEAIFGIDIQTACSSFTWIDGITYTQNNNTATFILTGAAGCDSLVTLNLTVLQPTQNTITETACESFNLNGETYTVSGTYVQHLTNAAGCDSTLTLHLTVTEPTTGTDVQTACGSFTWINGITYTESNNTATFTLTNIAGCDSVVTLNLSITEVAAVVVQEQLVLTAMPPDAVYQWIDCKTNNAIPGATSQSYTPVINGSYAVVVQVNNCTDTSECIEVTVINVDEKSSGTINIFPNPVEDFLYILGFDKPVSIEVYDVRGKKIKQLACPAQEKLVVDMQTLEYGAYFVKIISPTGFKIGTFVKK